MKYIQVSSLILGCGEKPKQQMDKNGPTEIYAVLKAIDYLPNK